MRKTVRREKERGRKRKERGQRKKERECIGVARISKGGVEFNFKAPSSG